MAVIIGIEEYKKAPKASFANRDAKIFYEYARQVFGIPDRQIYCKLDADASRSEFEKVFGENGWIARRVKPETSQVLVFFSCHGVCDIKTQEPYLLPYDADPDYALTTGYALKQVYESLSKLNAQSVTVFIDTCFSGMSRDRQMLMADAKNINVVPRTPKVGKNVVVLSASQNDQISSGFKDKKHGLFTYYLLKGLQGAADKNKDNGINLDELVNYVKENVSQEAVYLDREQTPVVMPILDQLDEKTRKRVIVQYK